jgi:hypothetical protein
MQGLVTRRGNGRDSGKPLYSTLMQRQSFNSDDPEFFPIIN